MVVNSPTWVPATELGSSERTAVLLSEPSFQTPHLHFSKAHRASYQMVWPLSRSQPSTLRADLGFLLSVLEISATHNHTATSNSHVLPSKWGDQGHFFSAAPLRYSFPLFWD